MAAGIEEDRADGHGDEADHHAALIANALDEFAGRLGEDEIGPKEEELDQRGAGVVQVKDRLEVRNQRIIQNGAEAPNKEQRRHHCHGAVVRGPG